MKIQDTVRRAGRSLRQAKARTLLTSLAIGVGAFTITLSLAAGAGGRGYAQDLISANTNTNEIRVTATQENGRSSGPQEYRGGASTSFGGGFKFNMLKQADIDHLATVDGVAAVQPVYSLNAQYVTRPGQKKYEATLTTYTDTITQEYAAGSGSNLQDNQALITEDYRQALGFASDQAAVGQPIRVTVERMATALTPMPEQKVFTFNIAGVVKASTLAFTNSTDIQITPAASRVLYEYNTKGTPQYQQYLAALVTAKDGTETDTVKQRVEAAGHYHAQTAQDLMSTLFTFINVLQGILLGFGALAVLTSIFGIINTQYISVLERTQQIGLMKALGMRRRDVGRLFKFEAAWIGFLGGAIGAGLAVAAGLIANPFISKALGIGDIRLLIFNPLAVVGVVVGLMLVSVGAGILPARKAAKLDPIEALRTE